MHARTVNNYFVVGNRNIAIAMSLTNDEAYRTFISGAKTAYAQAMDYAEMATPVTSPINIIFDGPPGPDSAKFVEVENDDGVSISIGDWSEREDNLWALRITTLPQK
jgi:hypothetical protein